MRNLIKLAMVLGLCLSVTSQANANRFSKADGNTTVKSEDATVRADANKANSEAYQDSRGTKLEAAAQNRTTVRVLKKVIATPLAKKAGELIIKPTKYGISQLKAARIAVVSQNFISKEGLTAKMTLSPARALEVGKGYWNAFKVLLADGFTPKDAVACGVR